MYDADEVNLTFAPKLYDLNYNLCTLSYKQSLKTDHCFCLFHLVISNFITWHCIYVSLSNYFFPYLAIRPVGQDLFVLLCARAQEGSNQGFGNRQIGILWNWEYYY
jgi:hypothetical protein